MFVSLCFSPFVCRQFWGDGGVGNKGPSPSGVPCCSSLSPSSSAASSPSSSSSAASSPSSSSSSASSPTSSRAEEVPCSSARRVVQPPVVLVAVVFLLPHLGGVEAVAGRQGAWSLWVHCRWLSGQRLRPAGRQRGGAREGLSGRHRQRLQPLLQTLRLVSVFQGEVQL